MDNLTAGNPLAHRVRVYFEGDNTIKEGMPLCYNFNTTKNWFGGSVSDGVITASNTTAEGSQNEGKYIRVTSPLSLSKTSLACSAGVITGSTSDFDDVEIGMFITIVGGDLTNGTYEVTAVSRYADTASNSTITLDMSAAADPDGTAATVKLDNIHAFAGVVTKGGWCGQKGPRVLDIYVPNGAIVPVRTDSNCLIDRTILAVTTASQEFGVPLLSGSRPVAIAKETVDRGTAGLVLAKLDPNMFIYQVSQSSTLSVDDADNANSIVNNINLSCLQTSAWCIALSITQSTVTTSDGSAVYFGLTNTGTGAGGFHVLQVRGDASGTAIIGDVNGIYTQVDLEASSAILTPGIATGILSKAHLKTGGGAHTGDIVAGRFELGLDDTTTGDISMFHLGIAGAGIVDYFFKAVDVNTVALSVQGSLSSSHGMKVKIGGVEYYIMLDAV